MGNVDIVLLIKMVIIAIVQGFTEPLPISSSGHVMIVSELLELKEQAFSFALLTNTASLFAIMLIYRTDILRLGVNFFRYIKEREAVYKKDFRFVLFLVLATIPVAILGLILKDYLSEEVGIPTIAVMLLFTGVALWLVRNLRGYKGEENITMKDAILVGLGQAVAIIPGISRSGATIVSALAVRMNYDTALRFSFMLYIPVSLGGLVLGLSDFLAEPNKDELWFPYIITFFVTMGMTYLATKWLIKLVKKGRLVYFTYYCLTVGTLLLLFF